MTAVWYNRGQINISSSRGKERKGLGRASPVIGKMAGSSSQLWRPVVWQVCQELVLYCMVGSYYSLLLRYPCIHLSEITKHLLYSRCCSITRHWRNWDKQCKMLMSRSSCLFVGRQFVDWLLTAWPGVG